MENNTVVKPNIEEIMSRIRADIRQASTGSTGSAEFLFRSNSAVDTQSTSPLLYSEELNYLNANWSNWNTVAEVTSHRKFIGPIIVKIKRKILDLVWNNFFQGYFDRERQFQMQLVRHLNATARYIDARDKQIFWSLIDKFDNDVNAVNDRVDRLFDSALGTIHSLEMNLERSFTQTKSHNLGK